MKEEETSEMESITDISSQERLKEFLQKGGEQAEYRKILTSLYSKKLIERTFPKGWKETLTPHHCYEILERIGQGITLNDLEGFYAEIKSGKIESEILKNHLVPYFRMWWAGSVRELPPYWFAHLVDLFRNPVFGLKIEKAKEKITFIDVGATLYPHYSEQVSKMIKNGDRSRPEFFYASRELLAKSVAYANPNTIHNGAVIPVFNHELGRPVFYTLKGQVHDNGLHAYLFVPVEKGDFPAQLIFRGTNGYASAGRDLDTRGVGKRVFQANKEKIADLVKEIATEKIEVIGHSLGAADAQRGIALLVEPDRNFAFKDISLYAFCAPRLEIECVNQWKADLKALAEAKKHPIIRLNFAHHESDAVTWTGDSYLSGAELDFIYSNYLTVRSNSGAMKTPAHHTTSFFKEGNFDFETDVRTFEFKQSFPKSAFKAELEKLEEIKNAWRWWRGVKSYFVKLESQEDVKVRIEEMRKHQAEISLMEKGGSQHSWLVYSGWSAIRYTVQPVVYYTFEGIRAIANWRH
jgi:hypothetical protein